MAVKSIIDIDIGAGEDKLRALTVLYDKYSAALAKAPGQWAAAGREIQNNRKGFEAIAAAMLAQNELTRKTMLEQRAVTIDVERSSRAWRETAHSTRAVLENVKGITLTLLKWTGIAAVASGVFGAGSVFGFDRLAGAVSSGRRSSLGLGLGYGEERAFSANFSRLVDPSSFLSAVAGAKFDVTKRVGLIGAGLTGAEMSGNTAQTSVALLQHLKQIADQTNPALYAQVIASRRLDQFVSPQDLERLRNTSPGEFGNLVSKYGANRGSFDLPADVSRRWQEFATEMTRAGQGIENTFVRGLAPITPGLTKLAESFEKVVRSFLSSPALEKWIGAVDIALEKFAKYIGTDDFQKNVSSFVSGLASLVEGIGSAVKWFAGSGGNGPISEKEGHDTWNDIVRGARKMRTNRSQKIDHLNSVLFGSGHNPGNLRPPGSSTGFAGFASDEAGVAAMARQIQIYGSRDHLDTVSGIVTKYAPPSENNTAAYIGDVSRKTGFAPGQHLDLGDKETMSQLIAAMISHEQSAGHYDKYKDHKVVVQVLNNTGGSANVSVNALKQ